MVKEQSTTHPLNAVFPNKISSYDQWKELINSFLSQESPYVELVESLLARGLEISDWSENARRNKDDERILFYLRIAHGALHKWLPHSGTLRDSLETEECRLRIASVALDALCKHVFVPATKAEFFPGNLLLSENVLQGLLEFFWSDGDRYGHGGNIPNSFDDGQRSRDIRGFLKKFCEVLWNACPVEDKRSSVFAQDTFFLPRGVVAESRIRILCILRRLGKLKLLTTEQFRGRDTHLILKQLKKWALEADYTAFPEATATRRPCATVQEALASGSVEAEVYFFLRVWVRETQKAKRREVSREAARKEENRLRELERVERARRDLDNRLKELSTSE